MNSPWYAAAEPWLMPALSAALALVLALVLARVVLAIVRRIVPRQPLAQVRRLIVREHRPLDLDAEPAIVPHLCFDRGLDLARFEATIRDGVPVARAAMDARELRQDLQLYAARAQRAPLLVQVLEHAREIHPPPPTRRSCAR